MNRPGVWPAVEELTCPIVATLRATFRVQTTSSTEKIGWLRRIWSRGSLQTAPGNDCRHPRFYDMPVCQAHAIMVYDRVRSAHEGTKAKPELGESFDLPQRLEIKFYVYYLRVGPSTVKIGYSRDLQSRMVGLRAELRSVMALEVGGRELERQRHMQFAEERDGRREDFELSDRLQAHIDTLAPKRMKLMTDAVRKRNRSIYQ